MTRPYATRKAAIAAAALLGLALVAGAGCGDDGGGQKGKRPSPGGRRGGGGGNKSGGEAAAKPPFDTYAKVPDELRHELVEDDFLPDPSGRRNRNPFRSYVVSQPGRSSQSSSEEPVDRTEICKPEKQVASNYSLRDLKLIGIVLRGTRSYALFRDGASLGHIAHRGDCLGTEKALVGKIGAGFVRLEVTPQAPQGATAPAPQEREILLHPEEYQLPPREQIEGEGPGKQPN